MQQEVPESREVNHIWLSGIFILQEIFVCFSVAYMRKSNRI